MYSWDAEARRYLDSLTESLRLSELMEWLTTTISDVWSINMDRYEPASLGDTARAFGVLSSDNIQQRALRASREGQGPWGEGRARATNPEGSLLITASGVDIHVLKAPRTGSRTPAWERDFKWTTKSYSRLNASARNTLINGPATSTAGQTALFETTPQSGNEDSNTFSDVFLVWSGDETSGLTAGWLGIPVLGPSPWVAVSPPLWWDETGRSSLKSAPLPALPTDAANFDSLEEPKPTIRMKPLVSKEEQS
jgi:hypothetical protein